MSENKARMPRKSGSATAEVQQTTAASSQPQPETTEETTSSTPLPSTVASSFGPVVSDAGQEATSTSTKKEGPKSSKVGKTTTEDGAAHPKKSKSKRRAKQPSISMKGRHLEQERKLAALILHYWMSELHGEVPEDGQQDSRRVVRKFTIEELATVLRVKEDDKMEKDGRQPLVDDLKAYFAQVESEGKIKEKSKLAVNFRTEAEVALWVCDTKIVKRLECVRQEDVSDDVLRDAFEAAKVDLVDVGLQRSAGKGNDFWSSLSIQGAILLAGLLAGGAVALMLLLIKIFVG